MFAGYIQAAMRRAKYELIEDGTFAGTIPGFEGVWSNAPDLESCREELQEVFEDWLLLSIADHDELPVIDGIDLNLRESA